MTNGAEPVTVLLYLLGFVLIFVTCRVFIKPIKWAIRLILGCMTGSFVMFVVNKLIASAGISFSINILTSVISGVLGIPGMIMTLVLSSIL